MNMGEVITYTKDGLFFCWLDSWENIPMKFQAELKHSIKKIHSKVSSTKYKSSVEAVIFNVYNVAER